MKWGVADLRNAFISKPDRIVWKAYSRENHVPLSWSFSARSGFCRCRLDIGLKAFCKILTITCFLGTVRPVDCDLAGQSV